MIMGIRGHDTGVFGTEEVVAKCKELGLQALQFVPEKSVEGFEFGAFSKEYALSLKEQLGGMRIAVLGSYINPSCRDEAELEAQLSKFKEKILYAEVLGADVVGTETGVYVDDNGNPANDTEEAYNHVLGNFRILAEYAKEHNVNIAVEGVHCFVINSPEKLARLLNDIGYDNVRAIFDPVNYLNIDNYMNQDEIINKAFDLFGDKIAAIHVKDFVVENGEMKKVIHGEGILNFKLIKERAEKLGIDIPFISEEIDAESAKKGFSTINQF